MIFIFILDVTLDEVFACKYMLIKLVKPVAIHYLLRVFKFTVILVMSIEKQLLQIIILVKFFINGSNVQPNVAI